jgi:hypothetical protein
MDKETFEHYKMQEALQSQQIDAQSAMYAPQMMEQVQQSQAVLVEQTNPKKIVEKIMLRLQGKDQDSEGRLIQVAQPKMNKEGIDNIWFILDSHINQNIILSNVEIEEIRSLMDTLQEDLVDDLSLNWKRYGIEKKTDLDVINDSILINIYLALKRAQGQNEKNWLGKISVEQISGRGGMLSPKKESFWSKFKIG